MVTQNFYMHKSWNPLRPFLTGQWINKCGISMQLKTTHQQKKGSSGFFFFFGALDQAQVIVHMRQVIYHLLHS